MHPSMAKLARAEDASLAFAEVTTAIALLYTAGGIAGPAQRTFHDCARRRRAHGRGPGLWAELEPGLSSKGVAGFMTAQHYKVIPGFEALSPKYGKDSAIAARRRRLKTRPPRIARAPIRFLRLGNMLLQRWPGAGLRAPSTKREPKRRARPTGYFQSSSVAST